MTIRRSLHKYFVIKTVFYWFCHLICFVIIIIYYRIHIINTNFLVPRIISSRLRINALISILGIMIGGALTGISGLFLSTPAITFIKIICDHVNNLKPWGILMSDDTRYSEKTKLYKKIQQLSKWNRKKK